MKNTRVGRWLIYGLFQKSTGCLFYVGKTHKRREQRLKEHIESAQQNGSAPVHAKIREILDGGERPEIFILKRVDPTFSWQLAEQNEIRFWRQIPNTSLPFFYPAQTPKSQNILILRVEMMNVQNGG